MTARCLRARDGLRPTEAARAIEPHAETMAAAAAILIRTISHNDPHHRAIVRIAASEIVTVEVLPPILTEFRALHPGIIIELSGSDREEDLLHRASDIAVRMTRPKQEALIARRIGHVTLGFHAHQRYLDERGRPSNMHELAQHVLIGFDRETTSIRALRRLRMTLTREDFALRADSHLAQLAAIRAGFGIGICQTPLARRDPNLVHLLPDEFSFNLEVWIAMHEDLRANLPMRAVFDHLAIALSAYLRTKDTSIDGR